MTRALQNLQDGVRQCFAIIVCEVSELKYSVLFKKKAFLINSLEVSQKPHNTFFH